MPSGRAVSALEDSFLWVSRERNERSREQVQLEISFGYRTGHGYVQGMASPPDAQVTFERVCKSRSLRRREMNEEM